MDVEYGFLARPAPPPRRGDHIDSTTDKPTNRGAVAGTLLIGTVLLCTGIGLGIGFAIGVPAVLAFAGLAVGFAFGFALVYQRFKDV